LIKREVKTALSMADGDVVVLGGLAENKEAGGSSGFSFLPSWTKSKNSNTNKSESSLNMHVHFQIYVVDGVFEAIGEDGSEAKFHALANLGGAMPSLKYKMKPNDV
jgi:hypothetical protein